MRLYTNKSYLHKTFSKVYYIYFTILILQYPIAHTVMFGKQIWIISLWTAVQVVRDRNGTMGEETTVHYIYASEMILN